MNKVNYLTHKAAVLGNEQVTIAATATATESETKAGVIILNSTDAAVALTLPAASNVYKGYELKICEYGGNNSTVIVTAGFGAGGDGDDTIALTTGESCDLYCDGSRWYYDNVVTAT